MHCTNGIQMELLLQLNSSALILVLKCSQKHAGLIYFLLSFFVYVNSGDSVLFKYMLVYNRREKQREMEGKWFCNFCCFYAIRKYEMEKGIYIRFWCCMLYPNLSNP